jgi:proteasome assembly chaperone (PAC2) family protein
MVSLVDGLTRRIDWPENDFYYASPEGLGRGALLLLGVEPNLRWRRFSSLVVDLAREYEVEMVVTLGALLADVPHTRPAPVTGTASDLELVEQLGLQASRYEGPTGIVGVLHDACHRASIPSVSLWAAVPHYVSLAPSPRAALALCQRLGDLLEAKIDTAELEQAVEAYTQRVTEAVSTDEDTAEYVQELERRSEMIDETSLPSGESLAAELTRFLKERDEEDGPPDVATDQ